MQALAGSRHRLGCCSLPSALCLSGYKSPCMKPAKKVKFPTVQERGMCREFVLPFTAVLCSWGMQEVFAEGSGSPRAPVLQHPPPTPSAVPRANAGPKPSLPSPWQSMEVPWCHICCPSWTLMLSWTHCSLATSLPGLRRAALPSLPLAVPVFGLWLWRCSSS